jgi:hypothetical protein
MGVDLLGKNSKMIITESIYDSDINELGDWTVCEQLYKSIYELT